MTRGGSAVVVEADFSCSAEMTAMKDQPRCVTSIFSYLFLLALVKADFGCNAEIMAMYEWTSLQAFFATHTG